MDRRTPPMSTDQVAAFVALARNGSIRQAAIELGVSEQGVRSRLLALEERLQVELYRKGQGRRDTTQLTQKGLHFLPHATSFLDRARDLYSAVGEERASRDVRVAASQYLILYLLVDAIREFRRRWPEIVVRVTTLSERRVEESVLRDPDIAFGVAAPYEPSPGLEYSELFALDWSFVAPPGHELLRNAPIRLEQLANEPLILFERGSTGRRHIMDAFHDQGLSPRVAMETSNTEIIIRMVEAGMGVSIVPLLKSGAVTRGRRVEVRSLDGQVRPIHSGILLRRNEELSEPGTRFLEFVRRETMPGGHRPEGETTRGLPEKDATRE